MWASIQAVTPIITMITLFLFRLETPTRKLIMSVSFIAFGTGMASFGEVNLSAVGLMIMMSSELFESLRLVMTQLLLTGLKFHPSTILKFQVYDSLHPTSSTKSTQPFCS